MSTLRKIQSIEQCLFCWWRSLPFRWRLHGLVRANRAAALQCRALRQVGDWAGIVTAVAMRQRVFKTWRGRWSAPRLFFKQNSSAPAHVVTAGTGRRFAIGQLQGVVIRLHFVRFFDDDRRRIENCFAKPVWRREPVYCLRFRRRAAIRPGQTRLLPLRVYQRRARGPQALTPSPSSRHCWRAASLRGLHGSANVGFRYFRLSRSRCLVLNIIRWKSSACWSFWSVSFRFFTLIRVVFLLLAVIYSPGKNKAEK